MEFKVCLHLSNTNLYPLPGSKHDHISDSELLQHFYADHNNEWLGILLQRYTMLLLGVSMKYLKNEEEAKDAVQQVFLKTINELHKYKVEYFKSWIYMIAKNHCLMKLRDKGRFSGEIRQRLMNQKKRIIILKRTERSPALQAPCSSSTKSSNYV